MHTHTHTHGSLQCIPFIQWINNQFPEHQATQPTPSGTTCTMDLTAVMPSHIQPSANTFQCQPLPHLTSTHSFSSCPLPSFCVRIEMHILNFSSHNNQHHPVYTTNPPLTLNNNKNHPLYDTNQPFASHNTQSWPLYSVRRSGSVRFFAPKTGNRGPQPVQDQPRYWGNRTEPPVFCGPWCHFRPV